MGNKDLERTGHNETLDCLRGVAAVIVVISHIGVAGSELFVQRFFGRGYLAVDFFFMLSGYVLARSYEPRLISSLTLSVYAVQ